MTSTKPRQKLVYQTNHDLILVGTCYADESPREPGVYMIPGGCVELEPPEIPLGKQCRWQSGAWVLEDIPLPPVAPVIEHVAGQDPALEVKTVIQAYMDDTAKVNGYESLLTAISYAEEPAVASFQKDGRDFRAWRSLVWAYVFAQLAQWQQEPASELTLVDLLRSLPPLPCEPNDPGEPGPNGEIQDPAEERAHAIIDPEKWAYLFPGD